MKLVIASDIHGAADACALLMDVICAEKPDRVVLLGDLLYHGPRNELPADYAPKRVISMLNERASIISAVRGNCEAEVESCSFSRMVTYTAPACTTACTTCPDSRQETRSSTVTRT